MNIRNEMEPLGWNLLILFLFVWYITIPNNLIDGYSVNQWADAIKHEEGATYGVGHCHNPRQVCINTVRHKFEEWRNNYNLSQNMPFIAYLAIKYCPYNSYLWMNNVQHLLGPNDLN